MTLLLYTQAGNTMATRTRNCDGTKHENEQTGKLRSTQLATRGKGGPEAKDESQETRNRWILCTDIQTVTDCTKASNNYYSAVHNMMNTNMVGIHAEMLSGGRHSPVSH